MTGAQNDIAGYLQHLQTQRKLSAHTLNSYQRDLDQLITLAAETSDHRSLNQLTQFDIRRYIS